MVEAAARKIVPNVGETQEQADQAFSIETCLRQSLLSNELSISHMKIGSLPLQMGDTLFLQVSKYLCQHFYYNDYSLIYVVCSCHI